tara:strand:- start:1554 stop:2042 length:489 start_codon:yes stop_codon:yes gene_type:complete
MTDELKKIIFSPQISSIFVQRDWIINIDTKKKYHFYFVDEIANYYLFIYNDKDKIFFQFTLDIEIPKSKLNDLFMLINFSNQNSEVGYFVFDYKTWKIKYNLIVLYPSIIEESVLYDFLKVKLDLISNLFHNFVSGFHNSIYGEKIDIASLELLFLDNEGCA